MEEYGISLTDTEGNARPLIDVIRDMQNKFGSLDEVQQAEIATTLVGKMQMSKFLAIINGGGEDFDKLTSAITNCDGKTEQMRTTMENTTSGSLKSLMSKIEDLAIEVGNKLLPTFTDIVDKLGDAVGVFGKLDDETQNNIIKWGLLGAAISPVTGIIGNVFNSFGNLFNMLGNGIETIGNVRSAMVGGSGLAEAMAGQSGLVGSIGKLVSAFGPLMTALTPFLVGGVIAVGVGLTIAGLCTAFKNMTSDVEYLADGYDHGAKLIEDSNRELADDVKNKYDEIKLDMEQFKRDSQTILADLFDETNTNTADDLEELKTICGEKLSETQSIVEEYGQGIKQGLELFNTDNITIFSTDQIQSAATSWMNEVNKNLQTSYQTFETTVTEKDAIIAGIMEEDGVTYEEAYATWQERVKDSYNEFYENLIEAQTGYQEDSLGKLQEFLANANIDYSESMADIKTQLMEQMREQNKVAEDSLIERNITIARLNDEQLEELNMTREEALAISELEYEQECEMNERMVAESVRAAAERKYATGEINEATYKEWCEWSDKTIKNCEDKEAAITKIIESAKETDSAIWESAMEAMNFALDSGYNEGEVYTTDFWNRLIQYYENGGTDIERAVKYAMGGVSDEFAEGANNVEESTKRIDDALDKTSENAHGDLGQIDSDLELMGSTVDNTADTVEEALTSIDTASGKTSEHVHGDLGQVDESFNNTGDTSEETAERVEKSSDRIQTAISKTNTNTGKDLSEVDEYMQNTGKTSTEMSETVEESSKNTSSSVSAMKTNIGKDLSTIDTNLNNTGKTSTDFYGTMKSNANNTSNSFDGMNSNIGKSLSTTNTNLNNTSKTSTTFASTNKSNTSNVSNAYNGMGTNVCKYLGNTNTGLNNTSKVSTNFYSTMKSNASGVSGAGQTMQSNLASSLGTTQTNFNNTASNVSRNSSSMKSDISSIQGKTVSVVVNFLSNGFNAVMSNLSSITQNAINAMGLFKDTVTTTTSFGDNYNSDDIYGMKDAGLKTISLSSFADDGISAYATKDSSASGLVTTAVHNYNNSYSTTPNNSNNKIIELLTQLANQQPTEIVIDIHDNSVRNDDDLKKLANEIMKEIDFNTRIRNKRF